MQTVEYINRIVAPAALKMLPLKWDSIEARAMMLAMGLQESKFIYRVQVGGPAHGFWQFESGGGWKGILTHPSTKDIMISVLDSMGYSGLISEYPRIEDNDILAYCAARCLLYTVPGKLPMIQQSKLGWEQYLWAWRPGKPHPETWDNNFKQAWNIVNTFQKEYR